MARARRTSARTRCTSCCVRVVLELVERCDIERRQLLRHAIAQRFDLRQHAEHRGHRGCNVEIHGDELFGLQRGVICLYSLVGVADEHFSPYSIFVLNNRFHLLLPFVAGGIPLGTSGSARGWGRLFEKIWRRRLLLESAAGTSGVRGFLGYSRQVGEGLPRLPGNSKSAGEGFLGGGKRWVAS